MKKLFLLMVLVIANGSAVCFCSDDFHKINITSQQLLEDSFCLAQQIFESNFRPTFLIALWRGGAPIGMVIHEYFLCRKAPIYNHMPIRVSAYNHDQRKGEVVVFNLEYIVKAIKSSDKLLIVDDIVDSGASVQKVLVELKEQCGERSPQEIKVAALYYKPKAAILEPDYFLYKTDRWIVFPHELEGLSSNEIRRFKGEKIFESYQPRQFTEVFSTCALL